MVSDLRLQLDRALGSTRIQKKSARLSLTFGRSGVLNPLLTYNIFLRWVDHNVIPPKTKGHLSPGSKGTSGLIVSSGPASFRQR